MADSLNIKLRVTGDKELDVLIKKLNEGTGTLNDLTQAKKLLNAEFKKKTIDTKEWKDYAVALADINVKQSDVRLATKAGHEEYFRAGLQLRQLLMTSERASGALGNFTNVITNSVSSVIQLRQMMIPLGVQMGLLGLGIAATVTAGIGLISFLSKQKEEAQKAAEEIRKLRQEYIDLQFQLDKSGVPIQLSEIDARIAILRSEKHVPVSQQVPVGGFMGGFKTVTTPLTPEQIKENQQKDNEIAQLNIRAQELREKNIATEHERAMWRASGGAGISDVNVPKTADTRFLGIGGVVDAKPVSVQAAIDAQERVRQSAEATRQALEQGAQQFSSTLISALVQGRNLAESIGLALLGIVTNVASGLLGGWIGGWLGIGGKAAAVAPSTSSSSSGPVMAAERSYSRGGFGPGQLVARGVIDGTDLAVLVEMNKPIMEKRGWR